MKAAREELERVPGGTTLIDADAFRKGAVANLEDVLAFAPGVFAQSRFGGGETRTLIRGSGISLTFGVRGIRFLRDGLPLNFADGFFNPELIEPLTARYVEVYRGANALEYGAATLGGAINFVSQTGYTAAPFRTRLELGSHGYVRPQISGGALLGERWDVFAALSGLRQDGFRDQSEEETWQGYANIGYLHHENAESRLHITLQESELELPGSLTQAQLDADPTQANERFIATGSLRDIDLQRFDFQHAIRSGARNRLDLGAFYQQFDLRHPLPFFVLDEDRTDAGLSLRQELHGRLTGRDNRFVWGARLAWGDGDFEEFAPAGGGRRGALTEAGESEALAAELFAEDQWRLTRRIALVAGLQIAYARREQDISFGSGLDAREDYTGVNPKLGLIWQASQSLQVFGNVSRSFEPPTLVEFGDATTDVLDEQTATTIEIGARGGHELVQWELAVYHSRVEGEILTVELPPLPSNNFVTANADDTRHSGVELGLDARLPLDGPAGGDFRLRANYTYSRFEFDGDPAFGDNDIPGVPHHLGRLELLYEHPSGFYIGPNLEAADAYYVDFTNTLETDAHTIYGLRAGYDSARGFSVFIEGRNLEDEAYASNTGLVADAAGIDTAVFNPGVERSVYAGVDIAW